MANHLKLLTLIRLGIDTQDEFIIFIPKDCPIITSAGFTALIQVEVRFGKEALIARVNIVDSHILSKSEASLSESAWTRLGVKTGDRVSLCHIMPITSYAHLRSKIHGNELSARAFDEILTDIVAGKYSNIHLSSFITACANHHLTTYEMICLTKSMVKTGQQLHWDAPLIVDKHSVGGIPGNRTTPIVVAIVAAAGLLIPKTSSRAITSPAGTADTIETMTRVNLSATDIQRVVGREGGCMAWGGALGLSPADDIIIKIERMLDLDPQGQMIASVLSKKSAIGANFVLLDMPVGPTAKIRNDLAFLELKESFLLVGKALGLHIHCIKTNGNEPIGRGIGPALEAKDILAVLKNGPEAPLDLKNKAILLAASMIEFGKKISFLEAQELSSRLLETGVAFNKFLAICEAQGGFKEPQSAQLTYDITATHQGIVTNIDIRNLSKVAKLAGAPHDQAAGIEFFAPLGTKVLKGQTLYRMHAESKGVLEYALSYANAVPNIITIKEV